MINWIGMIGPFKPLPGMPSSGFLFIFACLLHGAGSLEAIELPNDPMLFEQDVLFADRGGFGLPEAWDLAKEKGELTEVVVAVISSGIRTTHEDLRNRLWTNEDEIPGNGIDDDNNGYVDDIHGWNFYNHNPDIEDEYGEGTGIAGIIAAEHNNALGIAGIAPNAKIMSLVRMGNFSGTYLDGAGYSERQLDYEMIQYACDNGADIILINNTSPETIAELDQFPLQLSDPNVHIISVSFPWWESGLLVNSPQLLNFMETGDHVDYFNDQNSEAMHSRAHLVECALHVDPCLAPFVENDSSYIENGPMPAHAVMAGVVALLKGVYPEDDPAMITTRLIDGAEKIAQLEGFVASGGVLDPIGAISIEPENRAQFIDTNIRRDFNVEESTIGLGIHSSSGLPVDVQVLEGPVEFEDGILKMTGETGPVRIQAIQPGNMEYRTADPVDISFRINDPVKIIAPSSESSSFHSNAFSCSNSEEFDVNGSLMVRARSQSLSILDPRCAEVLVRVEDGWKVTGHLTLPDHEVEIFSGSKTAQARIAGDWIFVAFDASYLDNADPAESQVIYVFEVLDAENGQFRLAQVIRPPEDRQESILLWGRELQVAGRWMIFRYNEKWGNSHGLYRRNDEGTYLPVTLGDERKALDYFLSENYLFFHPNNPNTPYKIFTTGDNDEHELLQEILRPYDYYKALFSGEWLVLGDPGNSDRYIRSGAVHMYRLGTDGKFTFSQTLYADDAMPEQGFGGRHYPWHNLAMEDGFLVVSAPRVKLAEEIHDRQYVFQLEEDSGLWKQVYRSKSTLNPLYRPDYAYAVYLNEGILTSMGNNRQFLEFNLNDPKRPSQTLYFIQGQDSIFVDSEPLQLNYQATGEGEISFNVVSGPASMDADSIILSGEPGEVVIEGRISETWQYEPSEISTKTLSVIKHFQELDADPLPEFLYADAYEVSINAWASSGLPVHIEVTEGPGEVREDKIHLLDSGDFSIQLSQEGDWRFDPAEPLVLEFEARPEWRETFDTWVMENGWTGSDASPDADPDDDGITLLENYVFAGFPWEGIPVDSPRVTITKRYYDTEVLFRPLYNGPRIILQKSIGSPLGPWIDVSEVKDSQSAGREWLRKYRILLQRTDEPVYLRLVMSP